MQTSPYPAVLERLLAAGPSEPLVAEEQADDPSAWTKAATKQAKKRHHAEALYAFARAAQLEPASWRHPFEIARVEVAAGDNESAMIALAHSYWLDIGQASDAAWANRDLEPLWSDRRLTKLGIGQVWVVLGGGPDWTPHGLTMEDLTVRFYAGKSPATLQLHTQVVDIDPARRDDRIVWGTSCKLGDRVYTELETMERHFELDFPTGDGWSRPAARDYVPSLALPSEPDACEFRFYRMARPKPGEPLEHPPVWMADFCWTRGKPADVGMARYGRCEMPRAASLEGPFAVEAVEVTTKDRSHRLGLIQTVDLLLGDGAGQWKSADVETRCLCGADECKGKESGVYPREQMLWFAENGDRVRLRHETALEPGQTITACQLDIGVRGPHPWGRSGWRAALDLDVVASYCWRDGKAVEGACAEIGTEPPAG